MYGYPLHTLTAEGEPRLVHDRIDRSRDTLAHFLPDGDVMSLVTDGDDAGLWRFALPPND